MPRSGAAMAAVVAATLVVFATLGAAAVDPPVWATLITGTPEAPPLPYPSDQTDTLTQVSDDGVVVWHTLQDYLPDNNGLVDIYKWSGGTRTLVSRQGTTPGNGDSRAPSIGANGRIAFGTSSNNWGVADWTSRTQENEPPMLLAYVDKDTTEVRLPTMGTAGQYEGVLRPILSANGLSVAFESFNSTWSNPSAPIPSNCAVFRGTLTSPPTYDRVSRNSQNAFYAEGSDDARTPRISADGSRVAFLSTINTLDPTYTLPDSDLYRAFVRTLGAGGGDPMLVSANPATSAVAENQINSLAISGNGKVVAFVTDSVLLLPAAANSKEQVFVLDMTNAASPQLELVSQSRIGVAGNDHSLSAVGLSFDGRFVLFASTATNLVAQPATTSTYVNLYVRDRQLRYNLLVSRNGDSQANASVACGLYGPFTRVGYDGLAQACSVAGEGGLRDAAAAISPSGAYVSFFTTAGNLSPRATDGLVESGYLVDMKQLCNATCNTATAECVSILTGCQCKGDRAAQAGQLPEWGDPCDGQRPPGCGDGVLNATAGEQCDDGNAISGDGCNSVCLPETPGWSCVTDINSLPATVCSAVCGDGRVVGTEECDGVQPALACTEHCTVRRGWSCPSPLVACTTECGDGIVAGDEQCESSDTRFCQNCTLVDTSKPCFGVAASYCGSPSLTSLTAGASSSLQRPSLAVAVALAVALVALLFAVLA